jgi:type VI protein secretion system component Hcp
MMAFDAFMVIKPGGGETIKGESLDEEFKSQGASEILSFDFSSSEAGSKIQGILEGTAIASSIRTGSVSPSSAPMKEAKDITGVNAEIKKLEKRIDYHEEKHEKDIDAVLELTEKVSIATQEVAKDVAELAKAQVEDYSEPTSDSTKNGTSNAKRASKLKIALTKYLDSASSGLLKAYCQASDRKPNDEYKPFESVILSFRKAGGPSPLVYLKITLSKVDVTSYTLDSGSGSGPPRESLTLSFETFKVTYTSQSTAGSASGKSKSLIMGWDYETSKAT